MTSPKEFYENLEPQIGELESRYDKLQGKRGDPSGEVYHSFQNFIIDLALPLRGEQGDDVALRRLRLARGNWDMCEARMRAWEEKVDFAALGLAEKPSEAGQRLVDQIAAFLEQTPHAGRGGESKERG